MSNQSYNSIKWNGDSVIILNQKKLPVEESYITYSDYNELADAITNFEVQGASLIAITAAFGITLAAKHSVETAVDKFREEIINACELFSKIHPSITSLQISVARMKQSLENNSNIENIKSNLDKEAQSIFSESIETDKQIAKNGSRFIADGDTIMTLGNTGSLSSSGSGTAIGIIKQAIDDGKKIKVICCETRPNFSGSRIAAWELLKNKIETTVICDSMAANLMKDGKIQKIITGAMIIAANGDTANETGTYMHALAAKEHHIPFFVAATAASIDKKATTGANIPQQELPLTEFAFINDSQIVPEGVRILNPAFDITPAANITAIITEKGAVESPKEKGTSALS